MQVINAMSVPTDIEIAPYFAALALAADLAEELDRKYASRGRAATRIEKTLRAQLIEALFAADLDTIASGAYTFTIEPEAVTFEGGVTGEQMPDRLQVHRARKDATRAPARVRKGPSATPAKPVTMALRQSMRAVLDDVAPASGFRQVA
jgi:hypothetical protein